MLAAQVKAHDHGFLSRDISVRDLILNRSDVHHVYPQNYLKSQGLPRGRYNQVANYVLAQSEIDIAIGDKAPSIYFQHLMEQCDGGKRRYGGITEVEQLKANLNQHAIPLEVLNGHSPSYDDFLVRRRELLAAKLRQYFQTL